MAVDRTRIDERADGGDAGARRVQALLERLSYHLSGAQLGITITSLLLGFLAEPAIAAVIDPGIEAIFGRSAPGLSIALALGIATVVQMVFGELVPKALSTSRPLVTSDGPGPAHRDLRHVGPPRDRGARRAGRGDHPPPRRGTHPRARVHPRSRGARAADPVVGRRGHARRGRGGAAHPLDPVGREVGRRCDGAPRAGGRHRSGEHGRRPRGPGGRVRPLAVPRHRHRPRRRGRCGAREVGARRGRFRTGHHGGGGADVARAGRARRARPRRPAPRVARGRHPPGDRGRRARRYGRDHHPRGRARGAGR